MRLLPYHSHVVAWLFAGIELLLMAYHIGRCYNQGWRPKSGGPLILLILLLGWTGFFGYHSELFILVTVNTTGLMVVVVVMFMPLFFNRPDSEVSEIGEPSDRFLANCRKYNLTPREIDVVLLSRKGRRNKQIADELFISERTVEGHLRNIYEKVGCERSKLALINALNA